LVKRIATVLALVATSSCNDCNEAVKSDAGAPSRSDAPSSSVVVTPPVEDAGALALVDAATADALADADIDQMFDQAITMLEEAGNIIQANIHDCNAMGARLEAYHHEHADFVARVQDVYGYGLEAERRKEIQATYRKRFRAAWAKIRPGVMKCKDTPAVNAVIRRLWGDEPESVPPPPD
jgi:hypothetical protein